MTYITTARKGMGLSALRLRIEGCSRLGKAFGTTPRKRRRATMTEGRIRYDLPTNAGREVVQRRRVECESKRVEREKLT